ncbi:GNAT family N-acetyltransferase [Serratia marcescens]|uniref:GNAT family N-acetyltransferase n=1 Tax=Serratia marcescens TaxID=615 RepID=UPI001EF121CE|nr:GNAT family N-acetyltransferase [Serratia marcescens]ULH10039.1 GNAT family N-acetyltransferase [Serratia marcescens]
MKYQNSSLPRSLNVDTLEWRPLRDRDLLALKKFCSACNTELPYPTHLPEHEQSTSASTFVATTSAWHQDQLIACVVLQKKDGLEDLHELSLEIIVLTEWQSDFVSLQVRSWLGKTLSKAQEHCPSDRKLRLYASVRKSDLWLTNLLTTAGFRAERFFVDMSMSISRAAQCSDSWINSISSFRPAFSEELRLLCNEAFDGHWGTTPWSVQSWQEDVIECPDFLPELSYLLFSEETQELIAFVLTSRSGSTTDNREDKMICIDLVGTRPEFRGQGIASQLLSYTLTKAAESGFVNAELMVDTDGAHNALGLYEKLGFSICNWLTSLTMEVNTRNHV